MTERDTDDLDNARLSVEALLVDLRHVIGEIPEDQWPDVAQAVLDHHQPPIDEAVLTNDQAQLQIWCRAVLEGLLTGNEDATRAAALKVRQYEDSVVRADR